MPTLSEARDAYERAWRESRRLPPDAAAAYINATWAQLKLAMQRERMSITRRIRVHHQA